MWNMLKAAVGAGDLRAVDLQFAGRMETLSGGDAPELLLAAALASHRVGEGDVCVELGRCDDFALFRSECLGDRLRPPDADAWEEALRRCSVVGRPGERAPLILDDRGRLYLGRYWYFEQILAAALDARSRTWAPDVDRSLLRVGLNRLFPDSNGVDWQRIAATVAVLRPLCVVSGGPGTGKTRTVTSILALLAEQIGGESLRLGLAAPTGKAAARLSESIRGAKAELPISSEIAARIPEEAITLHRLLGFRPGRSNPRHGSQNPLHLDVLVVDEASMVDLPLMARLLSSLQSRVRLILLGDKDQLSSVEAGMVLGDICGRGRETAYSPDLCAAIVDVAGVRLEPALEAGPPIADHIVELQKSWRFREQSGIGDLARAVNRGDANASLRILADSRNTDVSIEPPNSDLLDDLIARRMIPSYRKLLASKDPRKALQALNRVRFLCAVRSGPQGVGRLNARMEQALEAEGLIAREGNLYAGRPVMLTVNDHARRLYNGDVGLILADPESAGTLRTFFLTADGMRRVLPSRLPPHETVFAMTVHKSQGSEFDEVVLVLPEAESRVLTRELVYTGVTRAKERVRLFATEERLCDAITRRVDRSTGLYEALWDID